VRGQEIEELLVIRWAHAEERQQRAVIAADPFEPSANQLPYVVAGQIPSQELRVDVAPEGQVPGHQPAVEIVSDLPPAFTCRRMLRRQ
jgi:hypothetical protein